MSLIHYRRAHPADAQQIASLMTELGYPSDVNVLTVRLRQLDAAGHAVFVAEQDSQLLGCVHAMPDIRLAEGATGEIASLVVKSTCRGEGIGKGLVDTAVDWLIDIGCPSIRIRANAVRKAAHGFYQALGFRCVKTQKVFRKDIDGS